MAQAPRAAWCADRCAPDAAAALARPTLNSNHFMGKGRPGGLRSRTPPAHLIAMTSDVTIMAALAAGMLSFLSPCVLPLVPPYLVYLAGTSLERLADAETEPRVRWETIAAAVLFVAGFSTVFVVLGAGERALGWLVRLSSKVD